MERLSHLFATIRRHSVAIYRSLYFPPTVICVAILVATLFGWQAAKQSLDHDLDTAADAHVIAAEQSIQAHLAAYEQILRGGVGLFQGSDLVTRTDWENYLNAFNVMEKYPAVQGIGYAQVLSNDDLPAVREYMATQGVPDFTIRPASPPRDQYAAVIYTKMVANRAPASTYIGYDMYSEPSRRSAMFKARDQNRSVITKRIQLITDNGAGRPNGFNMYAPYYGPTEPATAAERGSAIRGYVYASFHTDVFFSRIVDDMHTKALGFRVTVAGDTQPLYASPAFTQISKKRESTIITHRLQIYGQTWQVSYALDHELIVSSVQLKRPGGVLFFGVFSAVLVSSIIYLVLRGRARDLAAQQERAVELAKDELLSLASHQLRTPATGVKQYVGMVLQGFVGEVSEEQRTLLEKAYASNDRQLRIINEILHLAKIDSGRIVLARQTTDLGELVNDIVNEQRSDIAAAEHSISIHLPKQPILVSADTHMLRMAIENLLSNAIKYTHPGGKITVTVRRDRFRAYVAVKDNGIGIAPADHDRIFNQFSRLPNEMSQRVEGTGIGLYLTKHLVELHKGAVQVASEAGRGSTFTIALPLRKGKGL